MTMAILAEMAGVSISTVSRALADNPAIAAETRKKISLLAQEHGFVPNPLARGLRRQQTDTVGVVIPLGHQRDQYLTDPFIMTMIGQIADALSERNVDMLLRRIVPESEDWLERLANSGRVDGIIVLGQSDQHENLNRVSRRYKRMVVWGAQLPDSRYVTVGSDNRSGGRIAARHLIDQGRRNLLFLGHALAPEFAVREQGFREECALHPDVSAEYLGIGLVPEVARDQLQQLLARHSQIDGVFAVSDVVALSAIDVLEQFGRSVPNDISVVGYDNVALSAFGARPLTTIDQHLAEGAGLLTSILQCMIDGDDAKSVMIEPGLIVRTTSIAVTA
nr:LacI family DNA-binding transcriptional regulator [uncultured Sphingomonas sp.]